MEHYETPTEIKPSTPNTISSSELIQHERSPLSFMTSNTPTMQELLRPVPNSKSWVNDTKIRKLYLQASAQQWFAPQKIDFGAPSNLPEEQRQVWIRLMTVFYTLEKMGLSVIANMMPKAMNRLKSEEATNYLAAQCYDESRHVFAIESYLKKLGEPPRYDWKLHVLGQAASMGLYRVENWLFSTLFSENFASSFLRRARTAEIDQTGAEMCKILLLDESRHLHFLHIVLPDLMDRLSLFGRSYVKLSQGFIMRFSERVSRNIENDAALVGLNRRDLIEEVFENVEKAYESFGVSRSFLPFPKISSQTVASAH